MNDGKRRWWNNKELRSSLPAIVLILAFFGLVLFYKHGRDNISPNDAYALNVHTEGFGVALGVIITVFVIDALNRRRDAERRQQDLIDRLLREARSPEPVIASHALHEIQDRYLHTKEKSVLKGGYLLQARWEGVTLNYFNLQEAFMTDSTLKNSRLFMVEMQRASLWLASMTNVSFIGVNLTESNLGNSNLVRVVMRNVNLHGANFESANMEGIEIRNSTLTSTNLKSSNLKNAKLIGNKYDENTVLPNGKIWKQSTDLDRFTDPDHPNFWRSCDPNSPAYLDPEEETD